MIEENLTDSVDNIAIFFPVSKSQHLTKGDKVKKRKGKEKERKKLKKKEM